MLNSNGDSASFITSSGSPKSKKEEQVRPVCYIGCFTAEIIRQGNLLAVIRNDPAA